MKLANSILVVTLSLMLFSCSKEDNSPETQLSGKIDNVTFNVGDAIFETHQTLDGLNFDIYSTTVTNPCASIPDGVRIFFTAENTLNKQDLFVDQSSFEAFTITMFNPDGTKNIIATDGYFQILEQDDSTIKAEIDIEVDDNNRVSGVFTANSCN